MSDIVLTVDDGQPADAARFFAAGTYLLELLDDLSATPSVQWNIDDLRRSSAVSGFEAVGEWQEDGRRAAATAVRGLAMVRDGDGLSQDWNPTALGHAKDLVRGTGDRTKVEAAGNVVWLDQRLRDRLDAIAPWVREYYGSVRGELTGVNVTRGNRASIKPQGGGRVVHVGFPNALASAMREGLFEFVEITGNVRQNEDGRVYYVTADAVSAVEEPSISWRDLLGFMPEITDGLTVDEYLRSLRGE